MFDDIPSNADLEVEVNEIMIYLKLVDSIFQSLSHDFVIKSNRHQRDFPFWLLITMKIDGCWLVNNF